MILEEILDAVEHTARKVVVANQHGEKIAVSDGRNSIPPEYNKLMVLSLMVVDKDVFTSVEVM